MCTVEKKDLGCMNGWDYSGEPVAYTEHLEKCGEVVGEYRYYLGKGKSEMRKDIRYDVVWTNIGRCYNRYTCQKCGCSWTVDSSD